MKNCSFIPITISIPFKYIGCTYIHIWIYRPGIFKDGAVAGRHQAIVVQFLAIDSDPAIVHDHGDAVDRKFAAYETSGLEFEIRETSDNELKVVVEKQAK